MAVPLLSLLTGRDSKILSGKATNIANTVFFIRCDEKGRPRGQADFVSQSYVTSNVPLLIRLSFESIPRFTSHPLERGLFEWSLYFSITLGTSKNVPSVSGAFFTATS